MKHTIYMFFLFLTFAFFALNCSGEKKSEMNMETKPVEQKTLDITADMLTTTHDPVCGMDLTVHAINDTTIYKDQLYGFCSDYCKEKFVENPEEYLTKLEK